MDNSAVGWVSRSTSAKGIVGEFGEGRGSVGSSPKDEKRRLDRGKRRTSAERESSCLPLLSVIHEGEPPRDITAKGSN